MDYYWYIIIGAVFIGTVLGIILWQRAYTRKLVNKSISEYQSDLITKHCEEVENIYTKMRGWRHDYRNHIQVMKVYLDDGETEKLGSYLEDLKLDLNSVDTVVKTGNTMIDAILNSKLSLAYKRDIDVSVKAVVPKDIGIPDIDLCVIIGNLLDNAMEACAKTDTDARPWMRIFIGVLKGQLYVSVSNSMTGDVQRTRKSDENVPAMYATTKNGNTEHGYGLIRIDDIAARHNGYVNRQHEDGVFATEVLLPLIK
ncbi:MAG TPA: GHKL domain-containing protein [Oscillospiraceae bacterium]|mgnify:CR=1 FL=1|nr:GHKL domain-containing protein [Oscillospiraceae bacterium]HPK34924.1 GHKL domain-containing protein [Oscillospiraceae bacterium]HPR75367.1 GHKL domain-containing protein [Oscillospiraceae bacterium]